jgi:UDP-N-acetylglucosamine 2-epimerase
MNLLKNPLKIVSVVGARPEFIQATPVSKALRAAGVHEVLVHTGQHYDYAMSGAFFADLGTPAPDYDLAVGSGAQGKQTGEILARMEEVLLREQPDLVIVRGDTNSTLAGALAAAKLHMPIAHIEAGERSFDRRMPEEINRVVADALASQLFCVSRTALRQLAAEGITQSAHWVGDVLFDAMLQNLPLARKRSTVVTDLGLQPGGYSLVTIHRAANTDDPARLRALVEALSAIDETIILPLHPRTHGALKQQGLAFGGRVRTIAPAGYFDMTQLEENARLIATDSGGVQREAYFLRKPCLTLRDETEWNETIDAGWNRLVGVSRREIADAWFSFAPPAGQPPLFGDGDAAVKIAAHLTGNFKHNKIGARTTNPVDALALGVNA